MNFQNPTIQNKIKGTNIHRYGTQPHNHAILIHPPYQNIHIHRHIMQNNEIKSKAYTTCLCRF